MMNTSVGSYALVGTQTLRARARARHHAPSSRSPHVSVGGMVEEAGTFLAATVAISRKNLLLGAVVAVFLGAVGSAVALMPPGDD